MQRYKAIVAYDGTDFSGYQVQPHKRTVQSVLETVLAKMHKGHEVKVSASGRTDAGVHAKGQVLHFDSPLSIPDEKWVIALNSLLPDDLSILKVEKVKESFHARFDAVGKEYRYRLLLSKSRDPFECRYSYRYPYKLNIEAMQDSCRYLVGEPHDFTSFCSAKTEVVDKVRTIETIDFLMDGDLLTIRFVGNGFLYNMVRILVGTLLEVGSGERVPEDLEEILKKKDRRFAGKTAPAHGLYLWEVFY
ncbi:tRNA pseudouridine(38-40) synthase TruA [Neobacillus mesonae]|uniref:tRNA pseudouridine(38-40) synthase TruA n=1 Tax=Neobacillus mesonae TaxID=1193713 RepID=UPI00203F9000|nr:tRNA pseudouridine(38-40) synthase TruA [Neobacillus mesonae]MCM3570097.1 tRNA pseudouridine(38-40) synthase TruA [Neobacillus mesonae]